MSKSAINRYFDCVNSTLSEIQETQLKEIKEASELVSDSINKDGVVQVFGTGHSALLARELFFRAGSLAPINFVSDLSLAGTVAAEKSSYMERIEGIGEILFQHADPEPEDVFLVISNSGRNPVPIEFGQKASEEGFPIIAITSKKYSKSQTSRHSSGKRLLDVADVVLDNCGKIGDVTVNFPDMEQGVGATSTIAGSYILNAIVVEATANLLENGIEPPVFKSGNLDDGMDFNQKLMKKYEDRIRNW